MLSHRSRPALAPASSRRSCTAGAGQLSLGDGRRIVVRPIREQDAAQFARAYARLSPQSRQRRFLSVADQLAPADLRNLTAVDHQDHVALVAVEPNSEDIIGSARYLRLPGRPGEAELAVEVIDHWQHRGVGRRLVEALSPGFCPRASSPASMVAIPVGLVVAAAFALGSAFVDGIPPSRPA